MALCLGSKSELLLVFFLFKSCFSQGELRSHPFNSRGVLEASPSVYGIYYHDGGFHAALVKWDWKIIINSSITGQKREGAHT